MLLYCALFWIQGKTFLLRVSFVVDCTVPYFGFKAKHRMQEEHGSVDCTVPYFGFKAKHV